MFALNLSMKKGHIIFERDFIWIKNSLIPKRTCVNNFLYSSYFRSVAQKTTFATKFGENLFSFLCDFNHRLRFVLKLHTCRFGKLFRSSRVVRREKSPIFQLIWRPHLQNLLDEVHSLMLSSWKNVNYCKTKTSCTRLNCT